MVARMNRRFGTFLRDDDGLSLTELLVALVLLGMVLAIAWNLNSYMNKVNTDNEREAYVSGEVRTPLMVIDKLVMQNSLIEGGSDAYQLSFITDVNLDDVRERTVITVTGTELRRTTWNITGSGANIEPAVIDTVLSRNNANSAQDEPLFTYLDSSGDIITDTDLISSQARSVVTNILVDYDGTIYHDSRETHLRNRE